MPNHPETPASQPVRTRIGNAGTSTVAWLVILFCCGVVIWDANRLPDADERRSEPVSLSIAGELTAKMMVGLADWSPESREMILGQARALEQEGIAGQIARVVLAAEFTGLDDARTELEAAQLQIRDREQDAQRIAQCEALVNILQQLYNSDTESITLTEDQQTSLIEHLGWVGRLAPLVQPLAEGRADREALLEPLRLLPVVMVAFLVWMGVCLIGGIAAWVTLLVLGLLGRLHWGFGPINAGGGRAARGAQGVLGAGEVAGVGGGAGHVYAECFAVWAALFVGGRYLAGMLELAGLVATLAITIGALIIALGWAVIRGVRWRDLKQDLGLHTGRGVITETIMGMVTYCMAIPLLAIGLLMTLGLMELQKVVSPDAPAPGHPVQQFIADGDWRVILQTMLLAAIVAPLVEETIFRGALYRHLREMTAKWGLAASFALSAIVSSILFAAIHPQGWPFIPVLSSLAIAFCVAREWRGSLWPAIVAHGINNFVIMTLNVLLLAR